MNAPALGADARRREYSGLVEDYTKLLATQRLIASGIDPNRLWRGEIARYPAIYDRLTGLHDAVVGRQILLDARPSAHRWIEDRLAAAAPTKLYPYQGPTQ